MKYKKKHHERQLFYKLTWHYLNKEPHHIMRHIQGKTFKHGYILCLYPNFRCLRANDSRQCEMKSTSIANKKLKKIPMEMIQRNGRQQ
ncbi:unnamed protein product [Rotaria sordida]|uniref:Uncharacterized protein n=1 Tax=Rotaria sordida TaxID=392033 RepID=A0A813SE17_9BILA|nr:unnamed protein product [Rotaria sordida]